MKSQTRKLKHVNRDTGYRFSDERDPALDEICQLITDSGMELEDISAKAYGRVSVTTLRRWLNGTVKKPQSFTLRWVYHVLGRTVVALTHDEMAMVQKHRRKYLQ